MEFDDIDFGDYDFNIEPPAKEKPAEKETTTESTEKPKIKKKKLDESLLLSTEGIPRLMSEASFLHFETSGTVDQNLKKLMRYYQLWANNIFPKYRFTDFAQKVGTAASGKMVRDRIGVWQDEYRERHMVRAEAIVPLDKSSAEEMDDDEYNQILLDSVFPTKNSTTAENLVDEPQHNESEESQKTEEPTVEKRPSNRADALTILAEQRRKRNLAMTKADKRPAEKQDKKFIEFSDSEDEKPKNIEFSDSEDEQPTFNRKRRLINRDSEDEDDDDSLEKAKEKYRQPPAEIDFSSIPILEDIQMEDIGDVQLDEE